ncbi:MAG TPA: histidine kinase [Tenuifilaceae bacterium]|nr:histidine kinase [Tenuifilaceae bacterium]
MKVSRKITLLFAKITPIAILFIISLIQWSYAVKSNLGRVLPLVVIIVETISLFIIASFVLFILYRIGTHIKSYVARLILTFGLYFFAVIANFISDLTRKLTGYSELKIDGYFFIESLSFFFPILLVIVVYALVRNRMDLISEREEKLKAENLAQQARWMMLRYQVNPHFLFNALNTIRALIGHNDEQARKIVTEMSEYFRYSLSVEKKTLVTVREEMDAVRNYLEIQSIRFKDKLFTNTQIDEKTLDVLIPAFSIQTLAENAVKYGLKTSFGDINVEIQVSINDNRLDIKVLNTGKIYHHDQTRESQTGTQTGIENLKERLAFIDKDYFFSLSEKDGMVEANITIKSN